LAADLLRLPRLFGAAPPALRLFGARVLLRPAERGDRIGDGKVAVMRDPVGDLEVGGGVPEVDDLLGTFGHLPDGEGGRDGDGGGQRPPSGSGSGTGSGTGLCLGFGLGWGFGIG